MLHIVPKRILQYDVPENKNVGLRGHFSHVNVKRVWHGRQTFDLVNFFGHDVFLFMARRRRGFFGGIWNLENSNWYPFLINFKKNELISKKQKFTHELMMSKKKPD